jgi:hypothetical protein
MRFPRLFLPLLCSLIIGQSAAFAQWTSEWSSANVANSIAAGWFAYQQTGGAWQYRFYTLDSLQFRVMSGPYSQIPEQTYTFSAAERDAGYYIYTLSVDLNGDNIVDFYVLSSYGTGTPIRQAFRIFSLPGNVTLFERNDASSSFTYPTIWDADGDGQYECTFSRYNFPQLTDCRYDSYATGVPVSSVGPRPVLLNYRLNQNYPNPFNPSTTIPFQLGTPGRVRVDILNVLGQRVRTLVDAPHTPGQYTVNWDGTDAGGTNQASGEYFYQIQINGQPAQTKSMLLIR